jgi:hypothetical protein
VVKVLIVALLGVGAVLGVLAMAFVIGLFLPRSHEETGECELPLAPDQTWTRVTEFERYPEWQPWLARVERLDGAGEAGGVWRHTEKKGDHLDLRVETWEPGRLLVLRTADARLAFSGTWTLEIEPHLGGSRLRLTERGDIPNPLMRTLWRLFRPSRSSVRRFLDAA